MKLVFVILYLAHARIQQNSMGQVVMTKTSVLKWTPATVAYALERIILTATLPTNATKLEPVIHSAERVQILSPT